MIKQFYLVLAASALLCACTGTPNDTDTSAAPTASSIVSSIAASSAPAVTSASSQSSAPVIPGNLVTGKTQYEQQCQVCHGDNGQGIEQFNAPSLIGCSICNNATSFAQFTAAAMPPGGAAAAKACEGECATNVAAYVISVFNRPATNVECDNDGAEPSPSTFKRLSQEEYAKTIADLLQLTSPPDVSGIPDDPTVHNFKTIASVQSVQVSHLNGYITLAGELGDALMAAANRRQAVLGCDINSTGCLDTFIRNFGRTAFRRPLNNEEVSRIAQFAAAQGNSTSAQFSLALQVILSSPNFIYRVEVGNSAQGLSTLNHYELASRLAFTLWGQGPTAQLLDQAEAGLLDNAQGIQSVARQMLQDPRAKAHMTSFFEQWLATNLLIEPVEKPANWYSSIFEDMRAETNQLLSEYVWQDKDFMGVFTENRSYLSPQLANYYGLNASAQSNTATELPASSPRAYTGILTHGANMFAKTDGDLVAIRGNWLRGTFLCQELKLPAGIADIINGKFAGYTPLEIIAARNTDTACERCHSQIDPIGVAFAPFNRQGLYDHDVNLADYPIAPGFPDAGDTSVQSLQDIAAELAAMPEVGACLADRLFLYTRNHEPKAADRCTIDRAGQSFQNSGRQFASLLLSLVEDPSFRVRLAPEPKLETETPAAQNIALNRRVTASAQQAENPGSRAVDGLITGDSRWSSQYFPQQLTIDLGSTFTIVQTEVYPYEDRPYQYEISVSLDGNNYSRVVNRLNNTQGGNVLSDLFAPRDARYVKINVTGTNGNITEWASLREIKIFGAAK